VNRRAPVIKGSRPQDTFQSLENVARTQSQQPQVIEYTLVSGANEINHNLGTVPIGRTIVFQTVDIVDVEFTARKWSLTASGAGTVKVVWMV